MDQTHLINIDLDQCLSQPIYPSKSITYYDFDLDKPGSERWVPIVEAHADYLPTFKQHIHNLLNSYGSALTAVKILYAITPASSIWYHDEICYLAKRVGIEPHEALLMQLIYETSSACTSAVLKIKGKDFYVRTMDWPMMFLKDVTIGLNVKRGNTVIGKVVTWLGYIGFLTATNVQDDYTISINYRRTQNISITSLAKNLFRTMMLQMPVGYLVRDIIEKRIVTYRAICVLEETELITPCYVTVHIPNYRTYILTRDCDKCVNTRQTELVQTNCDWNKTQPDILYSLARVKYVKTVEKAMNLRRGEVTANEIFSELMKFPVLNEETVYVHYQYGGVTDTLV